MSSDERCIRHCWPVSWFEQGRSSGFHYAGNRTASVIGSCPQLPRIDGVLLHRATTSIFAFVWMTFQFKLKK